MKHSLPIQTLIGMGPEIVSLGLEQIMGQALAAVSVVVIQSRTDGRYREADTGSGAHNLPPSLLA
jgi:hypothetical protein